MRTFWLCFVPLFVAVDAVGVLPLYLSLIEGIDARRLHAIILQSVATATAVVLLFVAQGPTLLSFLGISVADFMIAGGLLLFAISLRDLLSVEKSSYQSDATTLGAVPLGVPLIAGPAVLTTCVLLSTQHGKPVTALAAILNIVIAAVILAVAQPLTRRLGPAGTKTLSKIASLLLAAIAVMLVRKGVVSVTASV